MKRQILALAALIISADALAAGNSEPVHAIAAPTVSLSARASRAVPNDLATASLFVEREDADAVQAEEAVTVQINKAHAVIKNFGAIKVKTAGHQAYPVWDRNRITRWRVRHELLLETADFKMLSKVIGAVQPYAQLAGIQFSVSAKLRETTEDQLIQEASSAFQHRADLVRQSFGAKTYRIKEISVQSGEAARIMPMARTTMALAAAEATPPILEGGSNEVSLSISGSVELAMP